MVPLSSEKLFSIFGFNITNTVMGTLLTDAVVLLVVYLIYKSISLKPGKLQNAAEMFVEYLYAMTKDIAGPRAVDIFPWFASFFIFIVTANVLGLMPGYALLGVKEGEGLVPIFRAPSSDLNTTFALAVISVVATNALSIKYHGVGGYLKRFFSLSPMLLFVGMLELVAEVTKLISFSFRLFGNIYAGEIVLGKVSSIFAYVAPLPFIGLELIVAVVQALIFAALTMAFMSIFTDKPAH
jgi:F-type H+-transporting ATPase subunit a